MSREVAKHSCIRECHLDSHTLIAKCIAYIQSKVHTIQKHFLNVMLTEMTSKLAKSTHIQVWGSLNTQWNQGSQY